MTGTQPAPPAPLDSSWRLTRPPAEVGILVVVEVVVEDVVVVEVVVEDVFVVEVVVGVVVEDVVGVVEDVVVVEVVVGVVCCCCC